MNVCFVNMHIFYFCMTTATQTLTSPLATNTCTSTLNLGFSSLANSSSITSVGNGGLGLVSPSLNGPRRLSNMAQQSPKPDSPQV